MCDLSERYTWKVLCITYYHIFRNLVEKNKTFQANFIQRVLCVSVYSLTENTCSAPSWKKGVNLRELALDFSLLDRKFTTYIHLEIFTSILPTSSEKKYGEGELF